MEEHEIKDAIRTIDRKGWWKKRDGGIYLDVCPQMEQGWFPLANQWAELLSRTKLNGSEFRLMFWWFRNAYGRLRKIMAHWPGAKEVGVDIGMNEDQVKRTLAGMCRAGMFKRKGDEIYVVKNWLTWDIWKWTEEGSNNPQSYPPNPQGANQSPALGGGSVTRQGANQSPAINKVVKDLKKERKKTPAHTTRGGVIAEDRGLLIGEFKILLTRHLKEEPTSFNSGAAAKGFTRLLQHFPRHDIQARFNTWFESTDRHIDQRGWRVEDFFAYFNRLKDGPILKREDRNDRRTKDVGLATAKPGKYAD